MLSDMSQYFLGILITIISFTIVGIYSWTKAKTTSDFSGKNRNASTKLIIGTVVGTFLGGSSTVGTSEMAFMHGLSAWWFTLGGGVACIIFALFFSDPVYKSNKETIPQIISYKYGTNARLIASIFIILSTLINISSQILAASAILTTIIDVNNIAALIISGILIGLYIIFGGIWGTGMVGLLKVFLIYFSVVIGGIIALKNIGSVSNIYSILPKEQYFNLFSRGYIKDAALGFSLIIGVLSNQTYYQAGLSGKSSKSTRKGFLISGIIIPPVGIACILIGLCMKIYYPGIEAVSAFPKFIISYMNPFLGGIAMVTLFVSIIGSGAGLALGISTVFVNDIYLNFFNKKIKDRELVSTFRWTVINVLIICMVFIYFNYNSLIIELSTIAMNIRGACIFVPVCITLFMKDKINRKYILIAMVASPILLLISGRLLPSSTNSLLGILFSLFIILLGYLRTLYSQGLES